MTENLRSIFQAFAHKMLVRVDLPERGSNQHEINGVAALRDLFQTTEPVSGTIHWHYFTDDADPLSEDGYFKFYDARARSAKRTGRTEWRLYYRGDFLKHAVPGDVLIIARTQEGEIFGLVFDHRSAWLRLARILFGIGESTPRLRLFAEDELNDRQLEFAKRQILEQLGLEISVPVAQDDSELITRVLEDARGYGSQFPPTARMAELTRSLVDVDFRDGDEALISLLDREERLFRAMEEIVVGARLAQGFATVDEFITYSLGVQNRRKSRMGYALQHHLEEVFRRNALRFETQVVTERGNTADFIFPGSKEYHDASFDDSQLVFLGAKSSLKERWRQVLDEADRILAKHLCTLEQGISISQTEAMKEKKLTLVIPASLHYTFADVQRGMLWTINEFIDFVRAKQK